MQKIDDWVAKRSGASITIYGYGRDSAAVKFANVASIEVTAEGIVATDKSGAKRLMTNACANPVHA